MGIVLSQNSYGKSRVRMMKVRRLADRHELKDLNVAVALEGDFAAAHTAGDNSKVLPTDTMKNTVYALGKSHPIDSIESFAQHLSEHFVSTVPHVSKATVNIAETPWERAVTGGAPHRHTFLRGGNERRLCTASAQRGGVTIESGLDDLVILKTTDSSFSGYLKDKFTTLRETEDRILGTSVSARWSFSSANHDYNASRAAIRAALIDEFCRHRSPSVQQTLYEMGRAALTACSAISGIRLSLPNKHCLLVELSPFGLSNDNEIFLPIDEPHGLIEASVIRE